MAMPFAALILALAATATSLQSAALPPMAVEVTTGAELHDALQVRQLHLTLCSWMRDTFPLLGIFFRCGIQQRQTFVDPPRTTDSALSISLCALRQAW